MFIALRPNGREPLYLQLVAAIRGAIVRGDVTPGERLPAARDLADSLGVNMHTVLKAYGVLRDEGVIELRRGRGAVVVGRPEGLAEIEAAAQALRDAARRHGFAPEQVLALLGDAAPAMAPGPASRAVPDTPYDGGPGTHGEHSASRASRRKPLTAGEARA